jgi:hypothetical protein
MSAAALNAVYDQMSQIRNRAMAFAPTPYNNERLSRSTQEAHLSGTRPDIVPKHDEENVLFATFRRQYDPGLRMYRFLRDEAPGEALQGRVAEGIANARAAAPQRDPRQLTAHPVGKALPLFPEALPKDLSRPYTWLVAHHSNHDKSQGQTKPIALGFMTLQQVAPPQEKELWQVAARDYPTDRPWSATAAATLMSLGLAAKDPRMETLAVTLEPIRPDQTPAYPPDMMALLEQLQKKGIPLEEYRSPKAGRLNGHSLLTRAMPASYAQTLKQLYPTQQGEIRVIRVPLAPFRDVLKEDQQPSLSTPGQRDTQLLQHIWKDKPAPLPTAAS